MTERIQKCVSFTAEEIRQLKAVCKDTGLKPAEVIRQLIAKAAKDKYCREIITNADFWEKQQKAAERQIGTTSHNVQNDEAKKDAATISDARPGVTYWNSKLDDPRVQEMIRIAKTPWIDVD